MGTIDAHVHVWTPDTAHYPLADNNHEYPLQIPRPVDRWQTVIQDVQTGQVVTRETMRAQLLQNATDDREGARGKTTDAVLTFRMRWLDGVSLENRVTYQGQQYEITGIIAVLREKPVSVALRLPMFLMSCRP